MILTAPILLTMRSNQAPIRNGAVVIHRGRIAAVGAQDRILKAYAGHRVLRFASAVLMPGLVNVHTHLELPPLLADTRARSFAGWVMNLIREKRRLSIRDYRAAASANVRALISTGTTTVGDISTHGVSTGILRSSGLRGIVYHEIISMEPAAAGMIALPGPGRSGWLRTSLLGAGISPHAPHTVSSRLLERIVRTAKHRNLRLAMHVAESRDEMLLLRGGRGGFLDLYRAAGWNAQWAPSASSPFAFLDAVGMLGPELLVVHAVHAGGRDIALLKRRRVPVAHCPRSNRETGAGRMPLRKFLDAGLTVGLGTDSLASAPSLSLWDEMRFARTVHRRDGITSRQILEMATSGGAACLGLGHVIGTLDKGKHADLIALPLPLRDTGDIYSDLLRETESGIMTTVNGTILHRA